MVARHDGSRGDTARQRAWRPAELACVALVAVTALSSACTCQDERSGRKKGVTEHGAAAGERSTVQCPPGTKPAQGSVRPAALAGSWYPGEADALGKAVDGFVERAKPFDGSKPIALVSPHAGYRFSGPTAGFGYRAIKGKSYGRVFLIGPSHRTFIPGVSIPPHAFYETPLGRVPVDRAIADDLLQDPTFSSKPEAHRSEHCLEIQLPFLQRVLTGPFAIVPMLVGRLDREQIQKATDALRAVVGPGDLVIASSDFTHYGPNYDYQPFRDNVPERLAQYADDAFRQIEARDVDGFLGHKERTGDTICGYLPVAILLGLLPADAKAKRLAFDTSGNITGDYRNSVSYLSVAFTGTDWSGKPRSRGVPPGCVPTSTTTTLRPESKKTAHVIARRALETWVRERERFDPDQSDLSVTEELKRPLGVFVTLKKHAELRGCIGNIVPRGPLHQAIAGRAIDASMDHRFTPVTPDELGDIEIEISVLTLPRPIPSHKEIVIGRDGVILRKRGRSAVFLPQVAPEQGWNVEQTLTHLARKAGLAEDEWREGAEFETFQALVF